MAVLACLYGLLKQGSIWYPINLLAATVYSNSLLFSTRSLYAFHLDSFLEACGIHLLTSLLVGLLYGAMLPMFPRRPMLLGGIIAPILWTGLLYSVLELLNPLLNQHIDWRWFIASQFAFGIAAGFVVAQQERIHIQQPMPFLMRAGFEAPGIMHEKPRRNEPR
jgi:MFS family permease